MWQLLADLSQLTSGGRMNTAMLASMKAPEGFKYLVIIPNHWGKGETINEAFANAAKSAGLGSVLPGTSFQLYLADPKAKLNEMGNSIERPTDGKSAVLIGTFKKQ